MSRMKQVIMKLIRSQQAQNKEFQNGMFNDQLKKQLPMNTKKELVQYLYNILYHMCR